MWLCAFSFWHASEFMSVCRSLKAPVQIRQSAHRVHCDIHDRSFCHTCNWEDAWVRFIADAMASLTISRVIVCREVDGPLLVDGPGSEKRDVEAPLLVDGPAEEGKDKGKVSEYKLQVKITEWMLEVHQPLPPSPSHIYSHKKIYCNIP